jgi:hypothetical protein
MAFISFSKKDTLRAKRRIYRSASSPYPHKGPDYSWRLVVASNSLLAQGDRTVPFGRPHINACAYRTDCRNSGVSAFVMQSYVRGLELSDMGIFKTR